MPDMPLPPAAAAMLELEPGSCVWPISDSAWCGEPVEGRRPYCAQHREASREQLRKVGPLERTVLRFERQRVRLVDQNTWRLIVRN